MPDFFTPVPYGAPIDPETWNNPLQQLNDKLVEVIEGGAPSKGLSIGDATELTIANGVIVRAYASHTVDTEADATEDDLVTIEGGTEGKVIVISAANANRTVVVKHADGNIFLYGGIHKRLDSIYKMITLVFRQDRWCEIVGLPTTALNYPTAAPFRRPTSMPVMMSPSARKSWTLNAAAATVQPVGIAAPTVTGNTASNQADSTYILLTTGAVAGNSAGIVTATYNLVQRGHYPKHSMIIQIGANASLAAFRLWLGLFSLAVTSVAALAGATEAIAFRYNPADGDTGFVPVTKDATTQSTGSPLNTVVANRRYLLEFEVTPAGVYFSVDNGTPVLITANLPAATTDLGFNAMIFTTAAAAKTFYFSRSYTEFD